MKINTKYNHEDAIFIKELKTPGRIVSILIGGNKLVQYFCRYFSGLDYKECYFYEEELSLQEENKEVGFKTK
jgi:hypothetical protein